MESTIVGTCEAMCPADEIRLRTREKLLHFYERKLSWAGEYLVDEPKVVKEFARSAAGVQAPKPQSLRTIPCLRRTVHYLLTDIIRDDRKPYNFAYDFIFDRLRAVRQEIVMQDFNEKVTIELIEPMITFLAYSMYRLVEEPIDRFDPKICRQHLQECLKRVLRCYDYLYETAHVDKRARAFTLHREFIESLYLLLNIGSSEALARAMTVPKEFRKDTFNCALDISLSLWTRNLYKCLTKIMKLPYILRAVASLHIQSIRRDLLEQFSAAYHSKVLTVNLNWLKNILCVESVRQLMIDVQYYGLKCTGKNNAIQFQREQFQPDKPIMKSRIEHFVDIELDCPIEDVLLMKTYL